MTSRLVTRGSPAIVRRQVYSSRVANPPGVGAVVPGAAVIAAGDTTTTYEDARAVEAILGERDLDRVLLVTSALHMPRALATFQAAGIATFPAPTDFEVTDVPQTGTYAWLPDNDAFWAAGRAFHEYIGFAWYRLTNRI